ncbi:uncharacterized protein T551_00622 [Pneumocystis jirovecii RU7]|uniref:RNB domain-containing protein n=1 Tax=Pneumocystis jirovecii (strain RU7) TaxID=1408657 RepID=A0A0W4ZUB9_PNEJ7|nr:uncharacterized protein T551_00622 [Pneumocystis jirovecii RU7]KTW31939.1 hypothetical protein T551_00622 [Pneumocystis jirovecii RU7]
MIEKYRLIKQNEKHEDENNSNILENEKNTNSDNIINLGNIFDGGYLNNISPCDLVEVRKSEYGVVGVVIQGAISTSDKIHVLLDNRKVIYCKPGDILFLIPSFLKNISSEELSNLNIKNGYLFSDNMISRNIIQSLRDFKLKSHYFYKDFLIKSDNLYQRLHHPDPDQHTYVDLMDLCLSEYGISKPNPTHLYALHTLLANDPYHYVMDSRNHLYLNKYEVRPKNEVEMIETVSRWIRIKSSEFIHFTQKMTEIIKVYRKKKKSITQATQNIILLEEYVFSETDLLFIKFMKQYFLEKRQFQNSIYLSFVPQILKATGMYSNILDRDSALLFMQEIGVWAPWENYSSFDRSLSLPGFGTSKVIDTLLEKMTYKSNLSPNQLQNFELQDNLENLRYDFGQLPVYVMDDSEATELDDGISIEKKSNNEIWLHIHIADPGAFVLPNSDISNFASKLVTTVFTPEKRYHMLPHSLTSSSFCLGSPLEKHSVLTFSAKLDKNGGILDFKISPAWISNIKKFSYDEVDNNVFNVSLKDISYCFSTEFPNNSIVKSNKRQMDQTNFLDKKNLDDIYKISTLRLRYRISNGFWQYSTTSANVKLQYTGSYFTSITNKPQFFQNYPNIKNVVFDLLDSPTRVMVAEMMILAGEIAAKYCVEKKLPVPFRSQSIILKHQYLNKYNKILEKRNFETGRVNLEDGLKLANYTGPTIISTSPNSHSSLALNHYVQATSPLRRYSDLITHWQIQASLKGKENKNLPFSKEYLDSVLPLWYFKEKTLKNFGKSSTKLWVCLLLLKIGLETLSPFHAWVWSIQDRKLLVTGIIKELGINCKISNNNGYFHNNLGDLIQIKITRIDLVDRVIYACQI